ncbi:F0F1 ATP synthase subunit A [Candidatus Nomurabacteria bacterium]|nr:F0F1 ATP synthase subunit A [Candidatus Nomurabacteria bacterium]
MLGQIGAIPPLAPDVLWDFGSVKITNTMVNAWVLVIFFLILGWFLRRPAKGVPGKLQNFVEIILSTMLDYIDKVTHDPKKSARFLPYIASLFFFILLSNWMGLLPGIHSVGRYLPGEHGEHLVSLFRPANTDLNMTLAMASFAVISSHYLGVRYSGGFEHFNKFIKVGDVYRGFKKGGANIMVGFVEFVVGLLETFAEFAKTLSLSLRLFGNIFAGEVLLTVIAGLVSFGAPVPFMFMELLVGMIQAVVFAMLTVVYFSLTTAEVEHH